ncbi:hypothetical protein [Streptomyces similanensis]|uniref:Uncharacterized protein n=1 Tax=Streptomyces similanensis TaxID=1274988 RepID=A0ABP9L3S3_9ACTN
MPLRLRAPSALLERARAVSLRQPGQHPRDYQGSMLTDAVTTSIVRAEPFEDDFLTGLLPLLRHGAALVLWRLAAAATSTRPEKAGLLEATAVRAAHRLTHAPPLTQATSTCCAGLGANPDGGVVENGVFDLERCAASGPLTCSHGE